MDQATGAELLVFSCWACGTTSTGCPGCVVSLPVDPATGLPPDVALSGTEYLRIVADPAALARAVKQPICEECAARSGVTERPAVRHARHCLLG